MPGDVPRDVDTWEDYQALLEERPDERSCPSAEEVRRRFDEHGYLADEGMATAVFLTLGWGCRCCSRASRGSARRPPRRCSRKALDAPLVRLQCYEGLTASEALYDWNHQRQLLAIRVAESQHERIAEADLFSEEFLVERPILRCIRYDGPRPPVLLIDEVDRADDEFEALLLEALGEGSVTVPELGTFTAIRPPIVVLTSNRSRDLHDALRRRCLYHWLEYPEPARVVAILRRTAPSADLALIESAAQFVGHVRDHRRGQAARGGRGDQLGGGAVRAGRHRAGPRAWSCRRWGRSPRRRTTATWWSPRSTPTRSADRGRRDAGARAGRRRPRRVGRRAGAAAARRRGAGEPARR